MEINKNKILQYIIITVLVLGFIKYTASSDKKPQQEDSTYVAKKSDFPIEYKIAVMDGKDLSNNSLDITRNKYLLSELEKFSGKSPEYIAEVVYKSQQLLLKDFGIKKTMADFMEEMKSMYPYQPDKTVEELSSYLIVRWGD